MTNHFLNHLLQGNSYSDLCHHRIAFFIYLLYVSGIILLYSFVSGSLAYGCICEFTHSVAFICHTSFYIYTTMYPFSWWCTLELFLLARFKAGNFPVLWLERGVFPLATRSYTVGVPALWEGMFYSNCHLGQTLEFAFHLLNPWDQKIRTWIHQVQ